MTTLAVAILAGVLIIGSIIFIYTKKKDKPPVVPGPAPTPAPIPTPAPVPDDPYCCRDERLREDGVNCKAMDGKGRSVCEAQACCTWNEETRKCRCTCKQCD